MLILCHLRCLITDLVYCDLFLVTIFKEFVMFQKGWDIILHEILKYKLNNLHVLILLHAVCFYFACYSSILVGAVG